jgi:hypothetical protein
MQHESPQCRHNGEEDLPTRLIDVEPFEPRIKMTRGTKGTYVALSHCWGGHSHFTAKTSNVDEIMAGMAMECLPANFRDAIIITRRLGFQYLWIDSLCILQDSKADWALESKDMGKIYQNAAMTIAASVSPDSFGGLLTTFEPPDLELSPPFGIGREYDHTILGNLRLKRNHYSYGLPEVLRYGALSSRGWAFQERFFSKRILHYGGSQIYWECQEDHYSADGEGATPMMSAHGGDVLRFQSQSFFNVYRLESASKDDLYRSWYEVVSKYCKSRAFTFDSDKLPALSRIVSYFNDLISDRYIAGLWEADLLMGLLWKPHGCHTPKSYRAPSWSWASLDGWIAFEGECHKRIVHKTDAELVSVDAKLSGPNPFGEIISRHLEMRGVSISVLCDRAVYKDSHIHLGNCELDGRFSSADAAIPKPGEAPEPRGDKLLFHNEKRSGS